jgi:hypothetical protein
MHLLVKSEIFFTRFQNPRIFVLKFKKRYFKS